MNLLKNSIFGMMAVALTITSCSRQTIYSHYEDINNEGWLRSDTVFFNIQPIPEEGDYAETVGLRMTKQYPFKNLALIINQQSWPSQLQRTDTLYCQVTNDHGEMIGKGINYHQYNMPLPAISLKKGDSLHISITHLMRRECIAGIANVGFTLENRNY